MLRALADLAAAHDCVGCGALGHALCAGCAAGVRRQARPGAAVRVAEGAAGPGVPVVALTRYADPLRRMIGAHKDDGRTVLVPVLAALVRDLLAHLLRCDPAAAAAVTAGRALVVPVPSSPRAVRARGRKPWEEVVRAALPADTGGIGGVGGVEAGPGLLPVAPVLRHRRRVRDQAGLGARQRRANLAGALVASPGALAAGTTVLLLDDVLTTGATLAEGVRALRAAGAGHVACGVLAAVDPARSPTGHPQDQQRSPMDLTDRGV